MNKLTLAAAVAATAPLTQGQTLHPVGQTVAPGVPLYIDLDSGTFGTTAGSVPNYDVWAHFSFGLAERPALFMSGGWLAATAPGNYIVRYTAGQSLSFPMTGGGYLEYLGYGPWAGGTGGATDYAAFQHSGDGREAWMGIIYNDAANTFTIESFAVAPSSFNLTAGGAVPEPAETAAVMALLAGGAALYHRRRQQKTAASPMA